MPDVISLLHKFDGHLFHDIQVGNYRMSIQGSDFHNCSPRKNLYAYMYGTMEVAVYKNDAIYETDQMISIIPPAIFHELKDKWTGWYFSGLTVKEIQWLYDNLYLYSKLEMQEMMYKFFDSIKSIQYEDDCIQQCLQTHILTERDGFLKYRSIIRMLLMLYGMR